MRGDGDGAARKTRSRSRGGPHRPEAGRPRRRADHRDGPHPHHRLGRAGPAAPRRARRRRRRRRPWANHLADAVRDQVGLEHGVALPVWDALLRGPHGTLADLAGAAARGGVSFRLPAGADADRARAAATAAARGGITRIDRRRAERDRLLAELPPPDRPADPAAPARPLVYLIVATGDIHEDIPQAQAAAREGADVVAVIRSTGQSLLDFVPEGATREGYAGTYATQENFRLMRAALDEVSRELGRYVRLTNYASGLCMPEIAALAGLERLDMMLNDCMYGIIFRDINPRRTFIDQRFSRQVHARAAS